MTFSFFSDNFQQARARFLTALDTSSPVAHSFMPHPLTGPDGKQIGTDVCHFGAKPGDATARLILSSGTHGIEGYAGSAIQSAVLEKQILRQLPDTVGVTLIHAINPFGFAHDRRVNEDNVDLNRNFVDHDSGTYPPNPAYAELNDAFNPKGLDKASLATASSTLRAFIQIHGADALSAAASQGQYDFPNGIFYGGQAQSWSNKMIRQICRTLAPQLERCLILDIHTGLGPKGVGEIIMEDPSDSPAYITANRIFSQGVTSTRPADNSAKSSSAALAGTIDNAFWEELGDATVISTTHEFGTVASNDVSAALRDDNWLYAHGDPLSETAKPIKQAIRNAFYPQSEDWKADILRQGEFVTREALAWLAAT